jgi:hypothetical protein
MQAVNPTPDAGRQEPQIAGHNPAHQAVTLPRNDFTLLIVR